MNDWYEIVLIAKIRLRKGTLKALSNVIESMQLCN